MRPYEHLIYEKVGSGNPMIFATLNHGGGDDVPIPVYTPPQPGPPIVAATGGVVLKRRFFQGEKRPHSHPPDKKIKTTVVGQIMIPDKVTIAILVRTDDRDLDCIEILTAANAGGKLQISRALELTASHTQNSRKAVRSRIRRNRPSNPYFVWSRDQYRFAILPV